MVEQERRRIELWFRRQGLPWLVQGQGGFADTLLRATPTLVALLVFELVNTLFALLVPNTDEEFGRFLDNPLLALVYLLTLAATYVGPVPAAWLTLRWCRNREPDAGTTTTVIVLIALYVLGAPELDYLLGVSLWDWTSVLNGLLLAVAAIVLAALGAGAVFVWALRVALRQLRALGLLAAKALPLLLLVTTFLFFTAEIWQITSNLPRPMLWGVLGLFAAVGLLFLFAVAQDELRELAAESGPERIPLRRRENANLTTVLALAQTLQAAAFGMLVFGFFLLLGSMAVRAEVIKAWISRDPTGGKLFGVLMPLPQELIHASMFLAVFSALYFATSVFTDAKYRDAFFDPLLAEIRFSLAERHRYLTRWPRATAG